MLVGFDIGGKESRIATFDRREKKPVEVSVKTGANVTSFPTKLAYMPTSGEWHTGFEADYFVREKGGIDVPDLLGAAVAGTRVGGESIAGWQLLRQFIFGSLALISHGKPAGSISGLCVTVENLTPALAAALKRALRDIGFSDEQAVIENYDESFYYCAYSQRPDVWNRRVGLISVGEHDVSMKYIKENRDTQPVTMQVKTLGSAALTEEGAARDKRFAALLAEWIGGLAFSGIFVVGPGFGEWAKESLSVLTRGKCHVFAGDSLFSEGACWAAREKLEEESIRGRIFLGSDMLTATVGIEVIDRGKQVWFPLRESGENWFDRDREVDLILDGVKGVTVSVIEAGNGKRWNKTLALDGLPERGARTTRIRLSVHALDAKTIRIAAQDLGFGELFPATYKQWEMEVRL